ncbi:unnamed protein product [Adineta steineri]|uniref:EF-hand domain-containing protein n=1 Tax=Adineta steineri TaxID=433720 RepID=A0A819RGZ9_9BILA|nr:unnamed protein product [Adineta steineri]CAF0979115.1 unnamed protein product [Adineta steineri]CAF4040529.1 unnamed protein product [Adineta steineri]CAF4261935.1 unnamed protein product [Adineta steineri]
MLGNQQERDTDIDQAFQLLDTEGRYGTKGLSDGKISPEELRVFLDAICPQGYGDICMRLADTNQSGQINKKEFAKVIKSGLARDIVCGRI